MFSFEDEVNRKNSAGLGSLWQTTSSVFIVDPTKPEDESLQSVRSTGHEIRSRDVDTHGTAGSQVQGRSASYGSGLLCGIESEIR
jgi:hypothetical protein